MSTVFWRKADNSPFTTNFLVGCKLRWLIRSKTVSFYERNVPFQDRFVLMKGLASLYRHFDISGTGFDIQFFWLCCPSFNGLPIKWHFNLLTPLAVNTFSHVLHRQTTLGLFPFFGSTITKWLSTLSQTNASTAYGTRTLFMFDGAAVALIVNVMNEGNDE